MSPFDYDLGEIKKALESDSAGVIPKIETLEDFERWLDEEPHDKGED